ncbi:MAG: hypothetical protein P8R42_05960 [Candidatus Binatia bacterium]|nr:hypothetical protein [Candidatus Binatia bacterium]
MTTRIVKMLGVAVLTAGLSVPPAFGASHEEEAEPAAMPEGSRGGGAAAAPKDAAGDGAPEDDAKDAAKKESAPAPREGS